MLGHMDMESSSQSAADFVRQLAGLTDRLEARDIVVSRLCFDWGAFGSWELSVQRGDDADRYGAALLEHDWDAPGPEVVRFSWDGRDATMQVDASPTEPLSGPFQWKSEFEGHLDGSLGDAIRFVEDYLSSRFGS